jgi:hypothetical protein
MSDTLNKLGEVCKHGSLRRQCEMCDLAKEVDRLERELAAANDECQRSFAREATAKAELQRREERKAQQGLDRRQSAQEVWNVLRTQLAAEQERVKKAQADAARYRWIRDVCPPNEIQEHIMQLPLGTDQVIDEQIAMEREKSNG